MSEFLRTPEEKPINQDKIVALRRQESLADFATRQIAIKLLDYWTTTKVAEEGEEISSKKALALLGFRTPTPNFLAQKNDLGFFELLQQAGLEEEGEDGDFLEELDDTLKNLTGSIAFDLNSSQSLASGFEYIEDLMTDWYSLDSRTEGYLSCASRLKLNGQKLKAQLSDKFPALMARLSSQSSVKNNLAFLAEFEELLEVLIEQYSEKSQMAEEKEKGCYETFAQFSAQNYQYARKALKGIFDFKLEAEIYNLAIQITKNNLSDVLVYKDLLEKSQDFLSELKNKFILGNQVKFIPVHQIVIPFVEQLSPKDLSELSEAVQKRLGYPLSLWGRFSGLTTNMVHDALKEEIHERALSICLEAKAQLLEEFPEI